MAKPSVSNRSSAGQDQVMRISQDPPLDEIARHFGIAEQDIRKWVREVRRDVAEKVDDVATDRAESLGGVHRHVAVTLDSLRPRIESRNATLILGGRKKDGPAVGSEFGALQYDQFPWWRGNDENAGYWVWPSIRELVNRGTLQQMYIDVLKRRMTIERF